MENNNFANENDSYMESNDAFGNTLQDENDLNLNNSSMSSPESDNLNQQPDHNHVSQNVDSYQPNTESCNLNENHFTDNNFFFGTSDGQQTQNFDQTFDAQDQVSNLFQGQKTDENEVSSLFQNLPAENSLFENSTNDDNILETHKLQVNFNGKENNRNDTFEEEASSASNLFGNNASGIEETASLFDNGSDLPTHQVSEETHISPSSLFGSPDKSDAAALFAPQEDLIKQQNNAESNEDYQSNYEPKNNNEQQIYGQNIEEQNIEQLQNNEQQNYIQQNNFEQQNYGQQNSFEQPISFEQQNNPEQQNIFEQQNYEQQNQQIYGQQNQQNYEQQNHQNYESNEDYQSNYEQKNNNEQHISYKQQIYGQNIEEQNNGQQNYIQQNNFEQQNYGQQNSFEQPINFEQQNNPEQQNIFEQQNYEQQNQQIYGQQNQQIYEQNIEEQNYNQQNYNQQNYNQQNYNQQNYNQQNYNQQSQGSFIYMQGNYNQQNSLQPQRIDNQQNNFNQQSNTEHDYFPRPNMLPEGTSTANNFPQPSTYGAFQVTPVKQYAQPPPFQQTPQPIPQPIQQRSSSPYATPQQPNFVSPPIQSQGINQTFSQPSQLGQPPQVLQQPPQVLQQPPQVLQQPPQALQQPPQVLQQPPQVLQQPPQVLQQPPQVLQQYPRIYQQTSQSYQQFPQAAPPALGPSNDQPQNNTIFTPLMPGFPSHRSNPDFQQQSVGTIPPYQQKRVFIPQGAPRIQRQENEPQQQQKVDTRSNFIPASPKQKSKQISSPPKVNTPPAVAFVSPIKQSTLGQKAPIVIAPYIPGQPFQTPNTPQQQPQPQPSQLKQQQLQQLQQLQQQNQKMAQFVVPGIIQKPPENSMAQQSFKPPPPMPLSELGQPQKQQQTSANSQPQQPTTKFVQPPAMPRYIPGQTAVVTSAVANPNPNPNIDPNANVNKSTPKLTTKEGTSSSTAFMQPPALPRYIPGQPQEGDDSRNRGKDEINDDNHKKKEKTNFQYAPPPPMPQFQKPPPYIPGQAAATPPDSQSGSENQKKEAAPQQKNETQTDNKSNVINKEDKDANISALKNSNVIPNTKFQMPPPFIPIVPVQQQAFMKPPELPSIPSIADSNSNSNFNENKNDSNDQNEKNNNNSNKNINNVITSFKHSVSEPLDVTSTQITGAFFNKRKPITAIGYGGLFLDVSEKDENGESTVKINTLSELFGNTSVIKQIRSNCSFSLNNEHDQENISNEIINEFIDEQIRDEENNENGILWAAVKVFLNEGKCIDVSKFNEQLSNDIISTPEKELLQLLSKDNDKEYSNFDNDNENDLKNSDNDHIGDNENSLNLALVDQIESIISESGSEDALNYAVKNGMWPIAFILANSISRNETQRVITEYIHKNITKNQINFKDFNESSDNNEINEKLDKFGRTLIAISGITKVETWKSDLGYILSHFTKSTQRSLITMSKYLEENNKVVASNVCKLLSITKNNNKLIDFNSKGKRLSLSITDLNMFEILNYNKIACKHETLYGSMLVDLGMVDEAKVRIEKYQSKEKSPYFQKLLRNIDDLHKKMSEDRIIKVPITKEDALKQQQQLQNFVPMANAGIFNPSSSFDIDNNNNKINNNKTIFETKKEKGEEGEKGPKMIPLVQTSGKPFRPLVPPDLTSNQEDNGSLDNTNNNYNTRNRSNFNNSSETPYSSNSKRPPDPTKSAVSAAQSSLSSSTQPLKPQSQQQQQSNNDNTKNNKKSENEKEQPKGWFSGFFSKLNPFGGSTKVVNLSEHDNGEMVWDGTRYVMKGDEGKEDDKSRLPPPPPKGLPPQKLGNDDKSSISPSTTQQAPPPPPPSTIMAGGGPPAAAFTPGRSRASNRYVANF